MLERPVAIMNPTLREQLIRAEQHFLLAVVSNDEESLKLFSQEWSQLARDVENTKTAGRLDDNTAQLLYKVSQAIENMTACMLESGSILQESLTCSISDLIQDIPSGDPSSASLHTQAIPPHHLLFSKLSSSVNSTILGQQKLLDLYAYCWLLQNIHNPYPNSMQMQIIGDVSGISTAQVELWFEEARDSIGWNKLSRDFFAGSVDATVAAARRVLLEHGRNVSFDVVFAFTAVKAFAEMLFLENPLLQEKEVDIGSIRTMVTDQDQHKESFTGEPILDPEGILVPPQVDFLVPPDPLSDLSDSDESEEEDTTPPPSIVGCKRPLAEDVLTSQAEGLARPQKRHRTWSIYRTRSSETGCPSPLPSTLGLSSEQTIPYISAAPVPSLPSLHPLSPTSLESSPDPPPSISQKKGYVDDTPEDPVGSILTDVSVHGIRKRRLSQCVSPAPSKRQRHLSIPFQRHSGTNLTPPSDECRDGPPDPYEFLQPMLQVPVDSDFPVNLVVFDWNSIPDPLVGTASSISQPAEFYVPSTDLASQLLEPPDPGHDAKFTSNSSSDLGSLEDLSSLLQFPMPAGRPPDLHTSFPALHHSGDSSLLLPDLDWSTITECINPFPPGSTQSSSPLTSSSDPRTASENSYISLPQSQSCVASEQLLSGLDSSVPPSAFLPFGSGAFTEDVDIMWSLFYGGS